MHKYNNKYIYIYINNIININTLARYTLGLHADRHNSTKLPGYKHPSANFFITQHLPIILEIPLKYDWPPWLSILTYMCYRGAVRTQARKLPPGGQQKMFNACDVMPIMFQTTCCNILECAFPCAASLCKSMFPTPKKLYLHTPSQIVHSAWASLLFGRGCIGGFGRGWGSKWSRPPDIPPPK